MMGGATDTEAPMTTQDPQLAPVQDKEDGEEDVEVLDLVKVSKKPSESSTNIQDVTEEQKDDFLTHLKTFQKAPQHPPSELTWSISPPLLPPTQP